MLAAYENWPRLSDPDRLADNTALTAAIVYAEDLYVDFGQSMVTASRVGALRLWITNEYGHNGLTRSPAVFDRLRAMVLGDL